MAGIYNPWANPETDETLTGAFATPDLMATGNPLAGGLDAAAPESEIEDDIPGMDDELEDATDPEDMGETETEDTEPAAPVMQALAVIQQQSDVIKMLLEKLKA